MAMLLSNPVTLTLQILLICAIVPSVVTTDIFVNTQNGPIMGIKEDFKRREYPEIDTTVDIFKGIPFAEPPVGDLRFRKPVPIEDWTDAWNATYIRPECWQIFAENFTNPQSEDCLYLNVWSPDVTRQKIPVMVWIHGGGFVLGSGTRTAYDGRPMVSLNDIVYVTINYRLSAFGFLATGDPELLGNYGLWDQTLALKWIKENIHAFGGDPDNISIIGQSAGAASVGLHLVAPASWGYFDRAMLMSGSSTSPWGTILDQEEYRRQAHLLAENAGCPTEPSAELANCLRKVPEKRLTFAIDRVLLRTTNNIPLVPVVDGEFLQDKPKSLLDQRRFKQCNIMVSATLDDGTLIAARAYPTRLLTETPQSNREELRDKFIRFTYTYSNDVIADTIEQKYIDWGRVNRLNHNFFDDYVRFITDEAFVCPGEYVAKAYALAGNDVYHSYLTQMPLVSIWAEWAAPWRGVAHGEDLQYLFGYAFNPYLQEKFNHTDEEIQLSLDFMRYYSNFVKTGDPNIGGDNDGDDTNKELHWMPYTVQGLESMNMKIPLEYIQGVRANYCNFINNHLPKMVLATSDMEYLTKQWTYEYTEWRTSLMSDWKMSFDDYNNTPCNP